MEKYQILADFGLQDKEIKTYLALLELGTTTIKPLAARASLKRTSLYNFIDHLIELGLLTQTEIHGRMHYQALPPSRLVHLQQERLNRAQELAPQLATLLAHATHKPRMSYYEGPDQMKNIVREEPRCQKETLYIWTGADIMDMIGGVRFMTEIDKARIAAGVQLRVIRFREKDIPFETSAHGKEFLRELRFAPPGTPLTMGMGIYDTGKVSFFSSEKERFGILIESQELAKNMRFFFELLWEKSTPAQVGEG